MPWKAVRLVLWWYDESSALEQIIVLVTSVVLLFSLCYGRKADVESDQKGVVHDACSSLSERQGSKNKDYLLRRRAREVVGHWMSVGCRLMIPPREHETVVSWQWNRHYLQSQHYSYDHWPTTRPATVVWSTPRCAAVTCSSMSPQQPYGTLLDYVTSAATWYLKQSQPTKKKNLWKKVAQMPLLT